MFLYLYLILGFPLLLVFCIFLNCSQSESEKKIQDLEDKVNRQGEKIFHFKSDSIYANYTFSARITDLENELKKLKKEIKK